MDFKFRRITVADKKRVLEVCRDIWEGTDYLPLVFDDWVSDENSWFIGVTFKSELIGFQRVNFITPKDAWLEGLRKDQKCNVKGVGKALNNYILSELKKIPGLRSIRLSTYIHNYESISIFKKYGFREEKPKCVKSFEKNKYKKSYFAAESEIKEYKLINISQYNQLEPLLLKSADFKNLGNNLNYSWKLVPTDKKSLEKYFFSENNVLGLYKKEKLCGWVLLSSSETDYISFMDYENEAEGKILLELLFQNLLDSPFETIDTFLYKSDKNYKLFVENNFESWETEDDFLILAYPLNLSENQK